MKRISALGCLISLGTVFQMGFFICPYSYAGSMEGNDVSTINGYLKQGYDLKSKIIGKKAERKKGDVGKIANKTIKLIDSALQDKPSNSDLYLSLARAYQLLYFANSDMETKNSAVEFYQKAIEINPDNTKAYMYLGNFYSATGDQGKANPVWEKAKKLNPRMTFVGEGRLFYKQYPDMPRVMCEKPPIDEGPPIENKMSKLLEELDKIEKGKGPRYEEAYSLYLKGDKNSMEKAIIILQKARDEDPTNVDVLNLMADVYGAYKNYNEVIIIRREIIKLHPRDAQQFALIAYGYLSIGETALAVSMMRRAVTLDINNAKYHQQLGEMYNFVGNYEQAQKEFEEASKIDPNLEKSRIEEINRQQLSFDKQMQFEKGVEQTLINYLKSNPDDSQAIYLLGLQYLNEKKFDKAEHFLLDCLRQNPRNAPCYYILAMCHMRMEKYDESLRDLQEAKKLDKEGKLSVQIRSLAKLIGTKFKVVK